ncbi:MAG TPA: S49 family peptidase, partial [Methylothermaceae bacterium]|nr:S49 family peptidase [Methylothermaceae bacterium]
MAQESDTSQSWERQVLEKLVLETVAERRRARRWRVFFQFLFFAYLVAVTIKLLKPFPLEMPGGEGEVTAKVMVKGMILPDAPASAAMVIKGLRRAAESRATKGIVLEMNSPGGSPVQALQVYQAIRKLKREKPDLPVIAVIGDVCA